MAIVSPFPAPSRQVSDAINAIAELQGMNKSELAAQSETDRNAPRPWDPTTCDPELREHLWNWCDEVAGWINTQYVWRPNHLIPDCWHLHPHIANELPSLACQRLAASITLDTRALEEWHRQTLPQFLTRLADRIGENNCRTGNHLPNPAASRQAAFTKPVAVTARREHFANDARVLRAVSTPAGSHH